MKRRHWLILLLLAAGLGSLLEAATNTPAPATLEELRARVAGVVERPGQASAHWGICVVSLGNGATLLEHQARKLFTPASVTKLFTGALALDALGPDYRIRTSVMASSRLTPEGRLAGDLVLVGRGDPAFGAADRPPSLAEAFAPLIRQLQDRGLRQIDGNLVLYEGYFTSAPYGTGWEWDDFPYDYSAEPSPLTIHENCAEAAVLPAGKPGQPPQVKLTPKPDLLTIRNLAITSNRSDPPIRIERDWDANTVTIRGRIATNAAAVVEPIPLRRPAEWFGQGFAEALKQRGITLKGSARTSTTLPGNLPRDQWLELAGADSPPVSELVAQTLKRSQNLYAQLLLLQVGARRLASTNQPRSEVTSEAAGIAVLGEMLPRAGIAPGEANFEEGTGLSRRTQVSPAAVAQLLVWMHRHRASSVFTQALPLAGVDGTLRGRLATGPAARNARAKTGSLRHVHSLAGYVSTQTGEPLAFAILVNGAPISGAATRDAIDEVVQLLAGFGGAVGQGPVGQAK
jgi:D-alanyl-D-alanine carboxypeptidase/D-alanyl-D-alanine-endopeptidase (penicillin-binding protein 4)